MTEQEMVTLLKEPVDAYGHTLGAGIHFEYAEATGDYSYIKRECFAYCIRECKECGRPFLVSTLSYDLNCGGHERRTAA